MSSASPFESDSIVRVPRRIGRTAIETVCLPAVRFVAFWTAVLLPFVLLSLLASGAIVARPIAAAGLLATNLVALVIGQGYNR
jgi:hypothetical protein